MADIPYQRLIDEINQTPTDINLYSNITARFKTWINNQTRLNATNMNELTSFIRGYSEQVGNLIDGMTSNTLNNLVELNAGWKSKVDSISEDGTRTVNQGELFNDYQNNIAEGQYSHSEGTNTKASGLGAHAQNISTSAEGEGSTAMGTGTKANNKNQVVLGQYNKGTDEDTVLEIGWGTSGDDADRKNIFVVNNKGKVVGGVSTLDRKSDSDATLTPKGYVDSRIERIDKNVWLGHLEVTKAQYDDREQLSTALDNAVLEFTKDSNPPYGRPRVNGDQVTVEISDLPSGTPSTPEIWMFVDPDPKGNVVADDPTPGSWQFFSSLQPLIEATNSEYGLVKQGSNIVLDNSGKLMMIWGNWS